MKNLSAKMLRKIIIEEMKKMIQLEDALFSKDDLTNVGTGTIVGLDAIEDEYDDDWYLDYVDKEDCPSCGGPAPCPHHDDDLDSFVVGISMV